jgi:hypothetical protein
MDPILAPGQESIEPNLQLKWASINWSSLYKRNFRKRFTLFPAEHWLCGVVISSLSDIFTF